MSKLLKIVCTLTLVITCTNLAHAADDLLGLDLPSGLDEPLPTPQFATSDLLLGLDLPTDFESPTTTTTPTISEPTTPVETPTTSATAPTITTTAGSGGAIGSEPVEPVVTHSAAPTPTQTTTQTFYTPTPSMLFNSQIASASVLDSQYDYSLHATTTKKKLAETGPAATLAFAIFGAIGLAFLLRKKFLNV